MGTGGYKITDQGACILCERLFLWKTMWIIKN